MANEHAVPEEKSDKVHGDKLDGVLEKTGGHGAAAPKFEKDDDGNGNGNGPDAPSTDGKTMP